MATARRAASQVRMGDYNQTVILEAIRHSPNGMSRVELAEVTGLSAQSISNIARQLLDSGLVVESGRTPVGRGKPRTMITLNPAGQYAVGIHLDPVVITTVVVDLCGATVARSRRSTPGVGQPGEIVGQMSAEVTRLVDESGLERTRLGGVGIAAPGPIDIERGVVLDPPNLDGWGSVPLRDALRDALRLPVLLDKDVTAAAAGEKWLGRQAGADFVFFYLGSGVGAGLVVAGQLVHGRSHNVGEIGGIIADPDGPATPDGRRGSIGEASQPHYLVARAIELGVLSPDTPTGDRMQLEVAFSRLAAYAAEGDRAARMIMDEHVRRVIKVAADIANLLDLDRVVFGGPHWPMLGPFFDVEAENQLGQAFVSRRVHPLVLTGTSLGEDTGAVGAASLVLDHTFSTNPSALLMA